MFLKLTAAGSSAADRKAAAAEIVAAVNKDGPSKVLKVCMRLMNDLRWASFMCQISNLRCFRDTPVRHGVSLTYPLRRLDYLGCR